MQKHNLKKDFIANVKSKIKRGFTLIELLVVISIIALLASVILSSLNTAQMKARDAQRILALQQIQKALELYYDKNGNYPIYMGPNGGSAFGILSTETTDWNNLASDLSAYLVRLPIDPINTRLATTGAIQWSVFHQGYTYYYRSNATGSKYDLVAWLEDNNNPLGCLKNNWYSNVGLNTGSNISTSPNYWCTYNQADYTWINDRNNLYDINGIKN